MTGLGLRMVTFAFGFRYPGWRYECAFGYAQIETPVQLCGGAMHWEPVGVSSMTGTVCGREHKVIVVSVVLLTKLFPQDCD